MAPKPWAASNTTGTPAARPSASTASGGQGDRTRGCRRAATRRRAASAASSTSIWHGRVALGEAGLRAGPAGGVGGGREREAGHHRGGAGPAQRLEREHQAGGARRDGDDVGHAEPLGGLGLELADERPVGEHAAVVGRREPGGHPLERRLAGRKNGRPSANAGCHPTGRVASSRSPGRAAGPTAGVGRRHRSGGRPPGGGRGGRRQRGGNGAPRPQRRSATEHPLGQPDPGASPTRGASGSGGRPPQGPDRQLGLVGEVEPGPRRATPPASARPAQLLGEAPRRAAVEPGGEGELGHVAQSASAGRAPRPATDTGDELLLEGEHRDRATVEGGTDRRAEQRRARPSARHRAPAGVDDVQAGLAGRPPVGPAGRAPSSPAGVGSRPAPRHAHRARRPHRRLPGGLASAGPARRPRGGRCRRAAARTWSPRGARPAGRPASSAARTTSSSPWAGSRAGDRRPRPWRAGRPGRPRGSPARGRTTRGRSA